jgi:hypothetical protein
MTGSNSSSSRGRRLPMIFMLLAMVVAMAAVAIGVGLTAGGMAVAKKQPPKPAPTTGATIQATSFEVGPNNDQTGEAYAKCPGKKRAVGGGVVQIGPPTSGLDVVASGPLDSTGSPSNTQSGDIAKQWYAAVVNRGSSGKGIQQRNFKVFAICSAKSDAIIEAKSFQVPDNNKSFQVTDNNLRGDWAVCPPNKRALGGGVVPIGPPTSGLGVVASSPLDSTGEAAQTQSGDMARQWYTVVHSTNAKYVQKLKVFAICE